MFSDAVRRDLIARHGEPHRHYHTLEHIQDCLNKVQASADLDDAQRRLLTAAVWFHDAVYDPTRNDNEAQSAALAVRTLGSEGWTDRDIAEVERLILLTAGHTVSDDDPMGARLISIDLSILGADPARYDAYAAAIWREYAHVPDALYVAGRAVILQRFLDAPVLFADAAWAARLDAPARENLKREIAALTA